jgi:hypothetical protein
MVSMNVIIETILTSWLEPLKMRAFPRITNGSSTIVAILLEHYKAILSEGWRGTVV